MTDSVYQRVLGNRMGGLDPTLRAYFAEGGQVGIGSGVFSEAGSRRRILAPVLAFLGWRRVLFAEYGTDVPFEIVNTPTPDGGLDAVRTFHFPGRDRPLEDTMRVIDGTLHDFLGTRRGFEVLLELDITDGRLSMRSTRQWLHLGLARIPLPRLATVTVDESWAHDKQHVDVRLRSPLLGEWFRYAGSFTYRHQAP